MNKQVTIPANYTEQDFPKRDIKFEVLRMKKSAFSAFFIIIILFFGGTILTAQDSRHFSVALRFVEITFNKKALYHQFIYLDLLLPKERYENNPRTKKYSEILVDVGKEVLDEYYNDSKTQKKIKVAFAKIYMEEFTENELL